VREPIPVGPYTRRVLRWLDRATPSQRDEGRAWYLSARKFAYSLASDTPYTLEQVAGVIAVLSPQVNWEHNKATAAEAVRAHTIGRRTLPNYSGFGTNKTKAFRVLDGDIEAVRGPKVTAFRNAITGDLSNVVLDIWAMRAARSHGDSMARLFRSDEMPLVRERRAVEEAYRRAAAARGLAPAEAQAIVWVACKASDVFAPPAAGNRAWYQRQNRERVRRGLSIITGDYAYRTSPVAQEEAVRSRDTFALAGIF